MSVVTYGSVCSGIEAATTAWHPLGMIPTWFAEIEPFPSAVLAHRFPTVHNLGDMTTIAEKVRCGVVHAPTILVGGTPCQAFSVAGLRGGLTDPRGELTIKYVELLNELDSARAVRGKQPTVAVWENVPGVLSSKDNAFGCFLAALAGENDELIPAGGKWTDAGCVYGPQRAVAWRVLDAQYFGLAQRRRRVFVVTSARAGFDPAAVLFEREGVRRDTPPSREPGQGSTGSAGEGSAGRGWPAEVSSTLDTTFGTKQGLEDQHVNAGCLLFVPAPFAAWRSCECCDDYWCSVHGTHVADCDCPPIEQWASDPYGRQFSGPISVHGTQDPDVRYDQVHTLGRNSGQENAVFAIQAGALRTNPNSGPDGVGVQADHAYTLEARAEVQAVAVAFQPGNLSRGAGAAPSSAVFPTLNANHGRGMSDQSPHVAAGSAVRRLTPTECERLQGFPDIRKTFTMSVSFDGGTDECLGHQKSFARAETKSLRSHSNVSHAGESEYQSNARAAALSLNAGQESSSEHVLVNVLIDSERQHLQLHSAGRLLLSVSTAELSDWCRLPIKIGDFVQLIARINTFAVKGTTHGEADSQLSMTCSTHRQNGSEHVQLCGHAISELVSDAGKFTSALRDCLKSTTSAVEQSSQNYDLSRKTLFSCVAAVICSCIPGQTHSGSSFDISIETVSGWTLIPWRNKPESECPDGPRYKAIGNSKAVPVVRWIGERLLSNLAMFKNELGLPNA